MIGLDVQLPAEPVDGVHHRELDVADATAWAAFAATIERDFGAVHGLVNNAAITSRVPAGRGHAGSTTACWPST